MIFHTCVIHEKPTGTLRLSKHWISPTAEMAVENVFYISFIHLLSAVTAPDAFHASLFDKHQS